MTSESAAPVEVIAEHLFRAFMSGDTNKLTTTALPSEFANLKSSYRQAWIDFATAVQRAGVPAGWVLVPRKITREIALALENADCGPLDEGIAAFWQTAWTDALAATPTPPEPARPDGAEVDYEVWQADAFGDGDAMVAGSTSLAEAQHYAAVYSQDGAAWVVEVTRRRWSAALTPVSERG